MKIKELLKGAFVKKRPIDYIMYLSIIVGGIAVDQLTKWLITLNFGYGETIQLIKGVLHLTYVTNPGAAFGMLENAPWVFNTFSVIAILALSLYLFLGRATGKLYEISVSLIIAGGIGNMIDRVSLGYVVDFIDFTRVYFPGIFNGADSFVCVGAGLMMLALIRDIIAESRAMKEASAAAEKKAISVAHAEDSDIAEKADSTPQASDADTEDAAAFDTNATVSNTEEGK